jgi:hypothetical protein
MTETPNKRHGTACRSDRIRHRFSMDGSGGVGHHDENAAMDAS